MIIYFNLINGYVDGWSSTPSNFDGEISFEIDKDHEFFGSDSRSWKCIDGNLIKDEERQQQLIDEHEAEMNKPSEIELLRQENEMLAMAIMELSAAMLKGVD